MIFFAMHHDPRFGTLYTGGQYVLTHRVRKDGKSTVRIDCHGEEMASLTGGPALCDAMKLCHRIELGREASAS